MAGLSDPEKLYGTSEPAPAVLHLSAGPLSAELEGGSVRSIRFAGHEAIRGIDYLLRDASWRTPPARFTLVSRAEWPEGFAVVFEAEVKDGDVHYRFRLTIEGARDGRLKVRADGEALTGFMTNRTGFVVLHPILGVAGRPVTVTHKDGTTEETHFPRLISPDQPILDIRALRQEVAPGLTVTCRMEAELPHDPDAVFEMEDQRNWTDASYKTYVGSLLDPWPYRIEAGARLTQKITLAFEGSAAPAAGSGDAGVTLSFGDGVRGQVPEIGLGLMPPYRHGLGEAGHPARSLRPQFITAYAETGAADFADILADYARIADALGAAVQLELVLPAGRSPGPELARAAAACEKAGLRPARVIASPEPYLKSVQPSGPWPEVADLGHIYNQARMAFPGAAILGGMLSYFTELNRKRPPAATIDGVTCTTTPIVHAADDRSVMETLEALPAVFESMAAIAPGKSLHIGPSAIAMRHNPYGAATAPNPGRKRVAMAEDDPRQRGLFAAAWTVGYAALAAGAGVASLALNHLAGPAGVAGEDGGLWPVYHAMAALCDAGDKPLIPIRIAGRDVAALAWRDGGRERLLAANLTAAPVRLSLPAGISGRVLNLASFEAAAADPDWSKPADDPLPASLELGAYAVLFGGR